jgi:CubicO group peptidase (beta-lactamase class C family)
MSANHFPRSPHRSLRRCGRAVAVTIAASLVATAVASAGPITAHAQPMVPTATFDPPTTPWAAQTSEEPAAFQEFFDDMVEGEQMLIDLDVDGFDDTNRVGSIYRPNPDGRKWKTRLGLTGSEYEQVWSTYLKAGYRLVGFESYVRDGERQYAGHWVENVEGLGWASVFGLTKDEFDNHFKRNRGSRMMPIDIDVYPTGSGDRYAVVWVDNPQNLDWKLHSTLTDDSMQTTFDAYAAQGLRLHTIDSYRSGDDQRYATLWIGNHNNRAWGANWAMTATGFTNAWNQMTDMGFRLDDLERYETAAGARFSAVWRQNDDKYDWRLRTDVDEMIGDQLKEFNLPGISVAITHEDKIVYERGFGYQDVDAGIQMHSGTVNRLASVSKAITGVLAYDVAEDYPGFSWTAPIRDTLDWLPEHHTYDFGDTLTSRTCLASYPDPMTTNESDQYDTAADAVEVFMDTELAAWADDDETKPCVPGTSYLYSTAGYSVGCAALEDITGSTTNELIAEQLTEAHGLDTLGPDDADVPNRTKLYDTDDEGNHTERDPDNLSWKTCGGGLQASAHDMAEFGLRLLDGSILSAADRAAMWTPIGSYAYGWNVGVSDNAGEAVVGKSGAQHGAKTYWRIYPDDDITIIVLSNRWGGDFNSQALAKAIGELMLEKL